MKMEIEEIAEEMGLQKEKLEGKRNKMEQKGMCKEKVNLENPKKIRYTVSDMQLMLYWEWRCRT